MGRPSKFSAEVRERAVRMVLEHKGDYEILRKASAYFAAAELDRAC